MLYWIYNGRWDLNCFQFLSNSQEYSQRNKIHSMWLCSSFFKYSNMEETIKVIPTQKYKSIPPLDDCEEKLWYDLPETAFRKCLGCELVIFSWSILCFQTHLASKFFFIYLGPMQNTDFVIFPTTFDTTNERLGILIIISLSFEFRFCNLLTRGTIASGDFIPFCILETFFAFRVSIFGQIRSDGRASYGISIIHV